MEGISESCHQVSSVLSHYCLCCLIAFILLWRKPSYRAQLQFYPQGPAISEQPSELPQRASQPNAQPLQCPRAVLQSAPSPDNRLTNILRKQGAETPAKQLTELVTQKGSRRGTDARNFHKPRDQLKPDGPPQTPFFSGCGHCLCTTSLPSLG